MTQLWSHRKGFRPALRDEFWTAFYTVLSSRLIPDYKDCWVPFYVQEYRGGWAEDRAESFMKEHVGHRILLFDTEEYYHRQEDDDRVLDYVEVFCKMANGKIRQIYAKEINKLFRRYNQPFELVKGKVHRRGSELLEKPVERLDDLKIHDEQLRKYLIAAREAFFDARKDRRLEGLRSLWDALERIKSLEDPDKRTAVAKLIDELAPYSALKDHVNAIIKGFTDIGNQANIRHSEKRVEIIDQDPVFIEYLFFSGFSLIRAVLQRWETQ